MCVKTVMDACDGRWRQYGCLPCYDSTEMLLSRGGLRSVKVRKRARKTVLGSLNLADVLRRASNMINDIVTDKSLGSCMLLAAAACASPAHVPSMHARGNTFPCMSRWAC
jgi:hypothetical protein